MNGALEAWVVGLVLLAAAGYLGVRFFRRRPAGKGKCGCGSGGCSASAQAVVGQRPPGARRRP